MKWNNCYKELFEIKVPSYRYFTCAAYIEEKLPLVVTLSNIQWKCTKSQHSKFTKLFQSMLAMYVSELQNIQWWCRYSWVTTGKWSKKTLSNLRPRDCNEQQNSLTSFQKIKFPELPVSWWTIRLLDILRIKGLWQLKLINLKPK